MDHANASPLLSDYSARRLDAVHAAEVEAHLRECAECRGVLAAMDGVRAEIREHGEALFTEHPPAEDVARWALASADLSDEARARIDQHLRACPTCSHEGALARDAAASAWRRTIPSWLTRRDEAPGSAWLRVAPVAAAVLLAFPAYLGLVELPRERARASRPAPTITARPPEPVQAPWSGSAKTLVLSGPTRGTEAVPTVRPEPGQPYLPIVLGVERFPDSGTMVVTIVRGDGSQVWRHESNASALWDEQNQVATVLVPTASLIPGEYRIDVRRGVQDPLFSARFRVISP